VEQCAQANLAVVYQRMATAQKVRLRGLVASAIAELARETALLAPPAVGARLEVEKRGRIEIARVLSTAADVTHRGCHAQKQKEERSEPAPAAFVHHGSTS
jgi:hypothetical protein